MNLTRVIALAVCLLVALGATLGGAPADAQGFERALADLSIARGATSTVGAYTWLEEDGIGIKLAPAAPGLDDEPLLIAGDSDPQRAPAGLWRLGADVTPLRRQIEKRGATFGQPSDFTFNELGGATVNGRSQSWQLATGFTGLLCTFDHAARHYALVIGPATGFDLVARRHDLLDDMYLFTGMRPGRITPLLAEGRYACALHGYRRDGERFVKRVGKAVFALRVFLVARTEFANDGALREDIENRLKKEDLRRTNGNTLDLAGKPAFVAEYFNSATGNLLRVIYGYLGDDYCVVVLHGPDSALDQLRDEARHFAAGVTELALKRAPEPPIPFSRVAQARLALWQDGGRLFWGVFFDDAAGKPVLWREARVAYDISLAVPGRAAADTRRGYADSSRDLNPLVDPAARAFDLPANAAGDAVAELTIGRFKLHATLSLRPAE